MWPKRNPNRDLPALLARIEQAQAEDGDLVSEVLRLACPRLRATLGPKEDVERLFEAKAWVELGFWLIGWELPDWSVHRLTRDDVQWCCSIGVSGITVNWVDDVVEFQHDNLSLAVLGALVQAQIRKAQGDAPSNVTAFRKPELSLWPSQRSKSSHPTSKQ